MARIMVIDDDADLRSLLQYVLSSAGHEVLTAGDGLEALNLQRTNPVQLIITDMFMPEHEGIETILEFRRDFPDVGIIAMSGASEQAFEMLSVARRMGAAQVLEKPFSTPELLSAIEGVLRGESRPA